MCGGVALSCCLHGPVTSRESHISSSGSDPAAWWGVGFLGPLGCLWVQTGLFCSVGSRQLLQGTGMFGPWSI